uniref:Ninjurin a n=1 Tax=Phlebotomus papatasi TaxID=29031 RepID=A0A1B0D5E7_PHLPP
MKKVKYLEAEDPGGIQQIMPTEDLDQLLLVQQATIRSPRRSRRSVDAAINDAAPLLETDLPRRFPPIAGPEIDENDSPDDDIPFTSAARPGVDDGFFPSSVPDIGPRVGEEDEIDEKAIPPNGLGPRRGSVPANFPYAPDFGPGIMTVPDTPRIIPDVNVYQHKKTLAQGMMDLALLSANANQLRYVLESYNRHPYYYFSVTFISMSLILQVAVGIGLIINSRYNVKNQDDICKADRINNFTNDDDVQSLRKTEDGDFSKKTEGDLLEKSDDSDDSDFLTADEDEDLEIKDSTKDKPSSEDPEKGIPPEKPEDCVVDSVPPGGIGPPHKPKGVDISQYLQKKSMAQGMLDLALLSANTNQLRYILETRDDNVYFYVSITLIISSLVLQVAVGIMLIWSHRFNMRKRSGMASANRINNLSVLGVFLITLINVFISTFGGSSNAGAAVPPASPPASPPVFPVPPSEPPKLPSLDVPVEPGAALA